MCAVPMSTVSADVADTSKIATHLEASELGGHAGDDGVEGGLRCFNPKLGLVQLPLHLRHLVLLCSNKVTHFRLLAIRETARLLVRLLLYLRTPCPPAANTATRRCRHSSDEVSRTPNTSGQQPLQRAALILRHSGEEAPTYQHRAQAARMWSDVSRVIFDALPGCRGCRAAS